MSRNSRFVSAAKGLLAVQVAGCVGAAGVTAWAAFEVRGLVHERDALAARVAQLETVIPPQLLPPPPAAIENAAPPLPPANAVEADAPPPDEAEPPDESDPVVNTNGGGPDEIPPPRRETLPCQLRDARWTATQCPLPLVRDNAGNCRDVQDRPAYCPGTGPGPLPSPPGPPSPPPPVRDCQSVQRQPIVCVPPFRRTPVPGVCTDGNMRPMRCPRGTPRPPRDRPEQEQPTQQPTRPLTVQQPARPATVQQPATRPPVRQQSPTRALSRPQPTEPAPTVPR